ncbi:MAG: EAL domain-containing protein, partial [Pseudomonadota bacterium]
VVDRVNRVGRMVDQDFTAIYTLDESIEVQAIVGEGREQVWINTNAGLISIQDVPDRSGRVVQNVREYPEVNDLNSLILDREGTVWGGSSTRLVRYLGDRFTHYRLDVEGISKTIWAISSDSSGTMYFGTDTYVHRMAPDLTVTLLDERFGFPKGPVRDIVEDEDGSLWVAIRGQGLFRYDPKSEHAELVPATKGMELLDLASPASGLVWIATLSSGVALYDSRDGVLHSIEGSERSSVYSLDVAADGTVWFGLDNVGLIKLIPQGNFVYDQTVYGEAYGMAKVSFDHIRITGRDQLWIGAEDGGLFRFVDGAVTNLGPKTPLRDQSNYMVEPLPDGTIVVGGEQGLYQIDPSTFRTYRYTPLTGFLGMESNVHATYVDKDGYLWLGTIEGASRMDVNQPMPKLITLNPNITHFKDQEGQSSIIDGSRIPWSKRGVMAEFVAISLREPKSLEYSYLLRGFDKDWGVPTTNRTVSYSSLPPGDYRFQVRARYPGDTWSEQTASRGFSLSAPFWRTAWFAILVLLLVACALYLLARYRTRQIENSNRRLREEVNQRTRSIENARLRLEQSNQELSRLVHAREQADLAREEVETRFRQAFENTPIGMGMLSPEGELLDGNPALRRMLWPDLAANDSCGSFIDRINEPSREDFLRLHQKLSSGARDTTEAEFVCKDTNGETLHTVVTLAAVREQDREIKYSVLQVQDVTEARKLNRQLEYQANYDELTGLLNRRSFEASLQRAFNNREERKHNSYLMFMDLDQFKIVNDTSGHNAGDELLKQVSEILRENVRADDVVGRLGGDEFGLVLWECPEGVARRIAEAIRQSIEEYQFQWDAETYRIGISIGAVRIDPTVGDIAELQQLADAACYEAKSAGRNRVHMVSGEESELNEHRGEARWVQRLHEAMDNNRFALYGQIIKPTRARKEPERVEVLLRMRDPVTRKLIPPGAFLPAAERYGLSVKLDEWVVKSLLDMLVVHTSFGADDRRFWVNLSGSSIGDPRFAAFLIEAMKNSPLPPGMINFEITETAVIRSVGEAGRLMSALRDMGCKFALDDFGSGLSSFGYLKKLPVDFLKIDGMFIRDIMADETDRIFVKSIIDIAHTMGMETIAEFVENDAILAVVSDLGADYVQGFGIHRPEVLAPQFPGVQLQPEFNRANVKEQVS